MKLTRNIAVVLAALAFGAVPAIAVAGNKGGKSGTSPGHTKSTPSKTNNSHSTAAYGRICRMNGATKTHVKGVKGTPFSVCVTALAHADKSPKTSAKAACQAESKKHIKGQKGTPFSQCVDAVNDLRS